MKNILFIFLLSYFFPLLSPACLFLSNSLQCQLCSFDSYDSLYNLSLKLSFSNTIDSSSSANCEPKITLIPQNRKILIKNSICSLDDIKSYDSCYEELAIALENETRTSLPFLTGTLMFLFTPGDHYIMKRVLGSSQQEFFRRSLFNITMKPLDGDLEVVVNIKTNDFFFYISGNLRIEKLIFRGNDIEIPQNNDSLACYNQESTVCCQNYTDSNNERCFIYKKMVEYAYTYENWGRVRGLFNIEYVFDDPEKRTPILTINNCTFMNFLAINNNLGWQNLFYLAPLSGNLLLNNSVFLKCYFPNGVIFYSINSNEFPYNLRNFNYQGTQQSILINNSFFQDYNEYWINRESKAFIYLDEFEGNLEILNSNFRRDYFEGFMIDIKSMLGDIIFKNISFYNVIELSTLIQIDLAYSFNLQGLGLFFIETKGIFNITNIEPEISIQKLILFNFEIDSFDTFFFANCNVSFLDSFIVFGLTQQSLFFVTNSEFIMSNVTFKEIICPTNFFRFLKQNSSEIALCTFENISQTYSLFSASAINYLTLKNTLFRNISTYNVFLLTSLLENIVDGFYLLNSTIFNVWDHDHTCVITRALNSLIQNNKISAQIITLRFGFLKFYFLATSVQILSNNFTSYAMNSLMGYMNFSDVTIIRNFFLDSKTFQYVFDHMNSEMFIINCYFEDNGVIDKKLYYLTKDNNILVSLWYMFMSYFINSVFVVGKQIDMVSGFIEAMPLNGLFECHNNTFIIKDRNPNFGYKGILMDHFESAIMTNNVFINIVCNDQDFYHAYGGVILTASSSFSYSKNLITVVMRNNSFQNCSCLYGGALAIIGIAQIDIEDVTFYNTSSGGYGGHLMAVAGESLNISGLKMNVSVSGDGGALYLQNFNRIEINNMTLNQAWAKKNGVVFAKEVGLLVINSSWNSDLITNMNGGFIYLMNTFAMISDTKIHNIHGILGGTLYLHGESSLILENSSINGSISNSGSGISLINAHIVRIFGLTISNSYSSDKGAAIFVDVLKSFEMRGTLIQNCTTETNGVIFIKTEDEFANFLFDNLICLNTFSSQRGSCIFYFSASEINCSNLLIKNNGPQPILISWNFPINTCFCNVSVLNTNVTTSIFFVFGINGSFENWTFLNNTATNFIEFQEITGHLQNFVFENNQGKYCLIIQKSSIFINAFVLTFKMSEIFNLGFFLGNDSNLTFYEIIIFSAFSCEFGCLQRGNLYLHNSTFAYNLGLLFTLVEINLILKNNNFWNNTSLEKGFSNDLVIDNSGSTSILNILVFQCEFQVSNGNSMQFNGALNISIIENNFCSFNGFVSFSLKLIDVSEINIMRSSFSNFNNGNIFIYNMITDKTLNLRIINCIFLKNTAEKGSALYVYGNFLITLHRSNFSNNQAIKSFSNNNSSLSGIGACMFFRHFVERLSSINITSNSFLNNSAFMAPTIFSQKHVLSNQNIFINNTDFYNFTNEIFSFPLFFQMASADPVIQITSGESFDLSLTISDLQQQTLVFDDKTFAIINYIDSKTAIALDNSLAQATAGSFTFRNFKIRVYPNTYFNLSITATFLGLSNTERNELSLQTIVKTMQFYAKTCLKGEIILPDSSCFFCPEGTFSLIDPMAILVKYQKCLKCPPNSFCFGGTYITPLPGFYRYSNESTNVIECDNHDACLGMAVMVILENHSIVNYNQSYVHGFCKEGSKDALCFYCQPGYGKYNKADSCGACASDSVFIYLRLGGVSILILLYVLLNFNFAENNSRDPERIFANVSTHIKLIVNHSQHITIILMTSGTFPFSVKNYLNYSDYFSFTNDYVISNDCLIQDFYPNQELLVVFRNVLNAFLPFIFAILSFVFVIIATGIRRNYRNKNFMRDVFVYKFLLIILLSIFIFYSLIVKSFFGLFNCMILDKNNPTTFMKDSPNLECWTGTHMKIVYYFGIPSFLIWGFFYPIFLFSILQKHSKIIFQAELENNKFTLKIDETGKSAKSNNGNKIQKKTHFDSLNMIPPSTMNEFQPTFIDFNPKNDNSRIFMFFCKDFKKENFYWECLIFNRKFILSFFSAMNETLSDETIFYSMLAVIFFFLNLTLKNSPYKLSRANFIEVFSLLTCAFTIFSSLVFKSQVREMFIYAVGFTCLILNLMFYFLVFQSLLVDLKRRRDRARKLGKMINMVRRKSKKLKWDQINDFKKVRDSLQIYHDS